MPTLASTSRVALRYKPEATWGTTPGTGSHYLLRTTGESLDYTIGTETSKEIRSDRQITDLIQTKVETAGGVNFELSYGEFDPFIAAALQGSWVAFGVNGVGVAIPTSATFAAGTLTAGSATSGPSIFTNLVKGQWVKIGGSSVSGQNIWAQVSTTVDPTATVLTFEGTPFTGSTGSGGAAVTVSASRLVNGTTQPSFTIEKNFADITQFLSYRGMTVSKMALNLASGSILTGSFDFMGKNGARAAVTTLPGTTTASLTNNVMNGVSSVANILEGGAVLSSTYIKSLSLSLDNALRGQDAIGVLGFAGIASGVASITGNLEVYFADGALYDKFIANTASSLSFRVNDGSLNGYVITLPNIKYGSGKITAGGLGQDVMVSMSYQALRDATSGSTILIDRAGAAVTAPV